MCCWRATTTRPHGSTRQSLTRPTALPRHTNTSSLLSLTRRRGTSALPHPPHTDERGRVMRWPLPSVLSLRPAHVRTAGDARTRRERRPQPQLGPVRLRLRRRPMRGGGLVGHGPWWVTTAPGDPTDRRGTPRCRPSPTRPDGRRRHLRHRGHTLSRRGDGATRPVRATRSLGRLV